MTKVLVSVPNQGWIHKHVAFALLRLQGSGVPLKIILPTHTPLENSQHKIIIDLLEGDYTHWLSFDADNPPTNNPLELIEYDKDIIGLPTPVYHNTLNGERPYYFNMYDYVPEEDAYTEHKEMTGLQKVDAIGGGCFLIKRRVFEHPEMQKGAFTRQLHHDGTVNKGNDVSFSERARENGFELYAHYDYPCMHFNEVELMEMIQGFNNIKNGEYTNNKRTRK